MCLGLGESTLPIHGSAYAAMSQRLVSRAQGTSPLALDDRKGVLIFEDGRVEVSLSLEDPSEIDVHLKSLAIGGLLLKLVFGSVTGAWFAATVLGVAMSDCRRRRLAADPPDARSSRSPPSQGKIASSDRFTTDQCLANPVRIIARWRLWF